MECPSFTLVKAGIWRSKINVFFASLMVSLAGRTPYVIAPIVG